MLRLAAITVLLLCASCVRQLGAKEPRWRRVQTLHFVVYTDTDEADAHEHAERLEKLLYAFARHGWEIRGELPLAVNVVMFDDPHELERFAGQDIAGYHLDDVLFEPWIVMAAPSRHEGTSVLAHELTHDIAYQAMQSQPPWLSEGLATYFETARFDREGRFVIGGVPRAMLSALGEHGLLAAEALLSERADTTDLRFYPTAWLLTHYLLSERGDTFAGYQSALASGRGHEAAWAEAFPDLDHVEVERKLRAYFEQGSYPQYALPVAVPPVSVRSTRLSEADEHALEALLWRTCVACDEQARVRRASESLRLALAMDPYQEQAALLKLMTSEAKPALEAARALTLRNPGSWRAWLALGFVQSAHRVLGGAGQGDDPVERALSLAPRQPYVWLLAALRDQARGEHGSAITDAKRAQSLAPTHPGILRGVAALYVAMGECVLLRRALETLIQTGHTPSRGDDIAALTRLSEQCVEPGEGAAFVPR